MHPWRSAYLLSISSDVQTVFTWKRKKELEDLTSGSKEFKQRMMKRREVLNDRSCDPKESETEHYARLLPLFSSYRSIAPNTSILPGKRNRFDLAFAILPYSRHQIQTSLQWIFSITITLTYGGKETILLTWKLEEIANDTNFFSW